MARPTDKNSLLQAADQGYRTLVALIESIPVEWREAPFAFEDRDKNVRDVLAHLAEWHRYMRRWYDDGMAGEKPKIPREGYTWTTLPALNLAIWEAAQSTPLAQALEDLAATHADMVSLITAHTDEELFTKKLYPWTGTTSLGSFLVSTTSSHYDWARKKLRKAIKAWG